MKMPTTTFVVMGWMVGTALGQITGNINGLPTGQYSVDDYLKLSVCNRWMRDAVTNNRWKEAAEVFVNGRTNDTDCAGGKATRWYVLKDSFLNLDGPNTYRAFYQYYDNDRFFLNTLAKRYLCSNSFEDPPMSSRRLLEEDDVRSETTRVAYCGSTDNPSLPAPRIREGLIKLPQVLVGLVNGFSESEQSIEELGTVSRDETRYVFGEGYAFTVGLDSGAKDSSLFYTVFRREENFEVQGNQQAIRDAYQEGFNAISSATSMTGTSGTKLKVKLTELVQKVSAHYLVTLLQSIERYALILDTRSGAAEANVEKWKEEMRLFYYGLAPFTAALDKEVHEELDSLMEQYDSSTSSDHRCKVRHIFEYMVQSMHAYGVSQENYGTLPDAGACPENDLLRVPNALALPLGSKWHTPYLKDGIPRLATDTKDYALLSYDVCEINEAVLHKQWEKAIEIYVRGKNAPDKSLYSYAIKPEPESVTWRRFRNAYGSETFIDDHVKEYFCSKSTRLRKLLEEGDYAEDADPSTYCSGYDGNPRGYEHASKTQAIPKAMQNWIGIYMSTVEFEKAVGQVEKGEIIYGARPSASHSLSEAYLFYTGARPGDDCSAYTTTDKRALNFGVSNQKQILQAYKRADAELKEENPSLVTVRRAYQEVTSLHLTVYAKGVTRYAYYLDDAAKQRIPPFKYGAEGKTFYKIIMPYVASVDPEGAQRVAEIFADENTVMEANQNYYCQVEEVMNCFVKSMASYGVSVEQNYGRLEEAVRDNIACSFTCSSRTLDYDNSDSAALSLTSSWMALVAVVSLLVVI